MSYEKQTWNTGDVITAEKLNHMEEGIGSGEHVLVEAESFEQLSDAEKVEQFNHCMSVFKNGGVVDVERTGLVARVTSYSDNPKYMVAMSMLGSGSSSTPAYTFVYIYISSDDETVTIYVGIKQF